FTMIGTQNDSKKHSNTTAVRTPACRVAAAVARLPVLLQDRHRPRGVGGHLGSIAGSHGTDGRGPGLGWSGGGRPGAPYSSSILLDHRRLCVLAGSIRESGSARSGR